MRRLNDDDLQRAVRASVIRTLLPAVPCTEQAAGSFTPLWAYELKGMEIPWHSPFEGSRGFVVGGTHVANQQAIVCLQGTGLRHRGSKWLTVESLTITQEWGPRSYHRIMDWAGVGNGSFAVDPTQALWLIMSAIMQEWAPKPMKTNVP